MPHDHDKDDTTIVAKALMRLFTHWVLDDSTQLKLLGLPVSDSTMLQDMRNGIHGLPSEKDIRTRASDLLTIHKLLRILYPRNSELLYGWVNMHNKKLNELRPIDVMISGDYQRVTTKSTGSALTPRLMLIAALICFSSGIIWYGDPELNNTKLTTNPMLRQAMP